MNIEIKRIPVPEPNKPIRLGDLTVGHDKLTFRGKKYDYDDVHKIYYNRVNVKVEKKTKATIDISFKFVSDGATVKVSTGENLYKVFSFSGFSEEDLIGAHEYLAKNSFDTRYKRYKDELAGKGCFEYSGAKFYEDGTVTKGNDEVSLTDGNYYIQYGTYGYIIAPPDGKRNIMDSLKGFRTGSVVTLGPCKVDTDVFVKLLKEIYEKELPEPNV